MISDKGDDGSVTLTAGRITSSSFGWSFAAGSGGFVKGGSLSVTPPNDLVAISRGSNFLNVRIRQTSSVNIKNIIIDGVTFSNPNIDNNISGVGKWGGVTYKSFGFSYSGEAFVSGQTYEIKLIASDDSFYLGTAPASSVTKKVTISQLTLDYQTILTPEYLKASP